MTTKKISTDSLFAAALDSLRQDIEAMRAACDPKRFEHKPYNPCASPAWRVVEQITDIVGEYRSFNLPTGLGHCNFAEGIAEFVLRYPRRGD